MKLLITAAVAFLALTSDVVATKTWGYKNNDPTMYGPSQWGLVAPQCDGKRQSPIDINLRSACGAGPDQAASPLEFSGDCNDFTVKQTSDSYKGEVVNGTCHVKTASSKYSLLQFHIHAPSEHTLHGQAFDAEAHFVHKKADGSGLLVIGLFLQKHQHAQTDPFFTTLWNTLGSVETNTTMPVQLTSYASILKTHVAQGHLFNYPGSLTTPTCDEIVDWWVIEKPLVLHTADFDAFERHLQRLEVTDHGKGARPVQPLNGRTITVY